MILASRRVIIPVVVVDLIIPHGEKYEKLFDKLRWKYSVEIRRLDQLIIDLSLELREQGSGVRVWRTG